MSPKPTFDGHEHEHGTQTLAHPSERAAADTIRNPSNEFGH